MRCIKLTYVSFWAHVKIASRIGSYESFIPRALLNYSTHTQRVHSHLTRLSQRPVFQPEETIPALAAETALSAVGAVNTTCITSMLRTMNHIQLCHHTHTHQTWNWVIGSPDQWVIFNVRVIGSPGHHFDPVWDPSFSGFRKNAQNAKRTFEMLKWQKSLSGVCWWTEITGCQSMQ